MDKERRCTTAGLGCSCALRCMSEKTVEVQLLWSPLNWQLSTIYQLYQLILFTKVYRKNDKIWKNWLTDWKLIVIFTTLKLIARSQQEKLKIFEKNEKISIFTLDKIKIIFYIWYVKKCLSREDWQKIEKMESFWKVLVINRTYWLQDQSCPSGAIGSAADS